MNKPIECPICGAPWLANFRKGRLMCLNCGAELLEVGDGAWSSLTKQQLDKALGPVALTRNRHFLSKEGLNNMLDDMGYPSETP